MYNTLDNRINQSIEIVESLISKKMYPYTDMVITEDSYFGRSTCSEVLPISISIILIYSLYRLFFLKSILFQKKRE